MTNLLKSFLTVLLTLGNGAYMEAQTTVMTEDFSGENNIFGVTATTIAAGTAAIHDTGLTGFGKVLAVCKATAEGTISDTGGQSVATGSDGTVTVEWDAFHGYFGNSRTSTVTLLNSDGKVIASYVYDCQQCKVTSATIGEQAVAGFTAFSLQTNNGFGGNGKPYTATGNPHISVTMTARGGVEMVFSKNGATVSTVLGSVGSLTKDIAKMTVSSTVENTDRCYAIDNIKVTTDVMQTDPDYVEPIASVTINGAESLTFGDDPNTAFSNNYSVTITGTDGTNITEDTVNEKVTDFKVVWDIEGFKTVNDTEGQYCDSYGSFSVNGEGRVNTTFDLKNVPMNFFGKMTATITYNGTTTVAEKYVVALGNKAQASTQVLPLAGYPTDFSTYPDALKDYTVTKETYGSGSDLIIGGWCVAGSDSHTGTLLGDADGTKYVRLTAATAKKSHVITKSIAAPTAQIIFSTKLRFNGAGATMTLTSKYPFWSSSSGYTNPVTLNFTGTTITLNNKALEKDDTATPFTTNTWYQVVLSVDKTTESCYALVYDTDGNLLGESGNIAWTETSSPTYFSIGMGNSYGSGSVDMASCEAFLPVIDTDKFTLAADKTTLSIPNGESAMLTASATDTNGYAITQQAIWSVLEEDMQEAVTITPDANDTHKAVVTLQETAEAGIATIQVNIGGTTKSLPLTLTSSAQSIKFTKSATSITIPMDDNETATGEFAAIIIDGEGNKLDGPVTLTAYAKDGITPFAGADGITFDASIGLLTVTAAASPTQLIIRATGQSSDEETLSKSITVNIHGMKFDFGYTDDASIAEGYTVVGTTTSYNVTAGYGIVTGTATVGGTEGSAEASADYLSGAIEFDFKVQKGEFYTVTVTYQGVLSTGYVNSDLAGYELRTMSSLATVDFTIPATTDVIDLHVSTNSDISEARIAQVTVTKQAKRQKRGKRVVHHIGDSTSANNGSWAYRLKNLIGNYPELDALCDFHNDGAGGRNLSTYYTQGKLYNVLKDIYPGDVVMFGNNGTNGMGSSFEADMNYYLDAAEALGAQVIINSYTPHGAVSNYASGYNATTHTFDSYRKDSYETIVRKVAEQRESNDDNYLGFVEIGKNADAAFNAYVADYAANGYASADAAAQAIIACFTDHNHYSNGTLACDLMLNGYGDVKGIVSQLVSLLNAESGTTAISENTVRQTTDTWYDLQGRHIANGNTKKGLYIVDGRKVVVK